MISDEWSRKKYANLNIRRNKEMYGKVFRRTLATAVSATLSL